MAQLVLNNKLLNNIKESSYYTNHEKHAKQKKALFMKKPSEFVQQRTNRLKKTHETMRQKIFTRKKASGDATRKKINLNLKKKIKFIC